MARDYSSVVGDLLPGQWEGVKAEWKISPDGFADRVRLIVPKISDEDLGVLETQLAIDYPVNE